MPGKRPEMREIATTGDGRDITRGFADSRTLLEPGDSILTGKGGGDLKAYAELLRDDQVMACFQQRRLAVVSAEWEVEAGGESPLDKQAAEFMKEQLEHIGWDARTDKMLFGVFYGFAVAELLYARDGARVVVDQVKVRDRRRFRFGTDGTIRMLTTDQPLGEELPPNKFWHFCVGADHDDEPYGLGLGHWLYWPVKFKRSGIKFWLIFLDKYGMPSAMGKYRPGSTKEEITKLLSALKAIQTDAAIAVPAGTAIELLAAVRGAGADYEKACRYLDESIAKVVLGQTLTSSAQSTGLGSGMGQTHMEVRQDLVKADADVVCESWNLGPARWLTDWNFPGAAYPRVTRRIEEPEDLDATSQQFERLNNIGYRPTLDTVKDRFGGEWETKEAAPPPGETGLDPKAGPPVPGRTPKPKGAGAAPELSEGQPPTGPDALEEHLDAEAGPLVLGLLEPVRKLMEECATLEEFRDRLLETYADMPAGELGTLVQRALAAAELGGMAEVKHAQ